MDLLKKLIYTERKRLDLCDVESIKNREDRSTLFFHSMFPEIFLSEEVAYPDEVKRLAIDVGFDNGYELFHEKTYSTLWGTKGSINVSKRTS
jgi:hypothetical protein